MSDVTQLLSAIESGDPLAGERLLPVVYDELRRLAAQKLAQEKPGQTLQATALVHEAWMKLVGNDRPWENRGHFFGAASEAMRRILVDAARRKQRIRHGGGQQRVDLEDADLAIEAPSEELVALDEALTRLAKTEPEAAQIVQLHYFGGQSIEEVAEILGISRATAYRQWTYARASLRVMISGEPDGS